MSAVRPPSTTRDRFVLRRGRERLRVGPWRGSSQIAHLTPAPDSPPPSGALVARGVDRCAELGYRELVTAALGPREQIAFLRNGFALREHLHLLTHDLADLPVRADAPATLRRARRGDHAEVLELDNVAFDDFWRLDDAGLRDALNATPTVRFRVAEHDSHLAGYAICGRAGDRGYLQRLAVAPHAEGAGVGRALILDALEWLRRRGVTRAAVNTQDRNQRALRLYESLGFRREPDGLVVLSRPVERPGPDVGNGDDQDRDGDGRPDDGGRP